ncbi:hypothetical protein NPIL_630411 [Nephila pilipes]|uniref:Retroviral polymerase SH3-like domain-containing protein n=1 Tax=Nephila pilipes TaxID=299642 RepID=A0A8X6JG73_NEPPI|nr:hypothetical protein NPIL_630411 [Nephila pilipes]
MNWTGGGGPDVSNIRTFRTRAFAYIHKSKSEKLDAKAIEEILIGYGQRNKDCIIYTSDHKKKLTYKKNPIMNKVTPQILHPCYYPRDPADQIMEDPLKDLATFLMKENDPENYKKSS